MGTEMVNAINELRNAFMLCLVEDYKLALISHNKRLKANLEQVFTSPDFELWNTTQMSGTEMISAIQKGVR